MNNYSDEDLERALFALDLEEPPADLRGSILASTCYRAPVIFKQWEIVALGAALAVVAWVAWAVVTGGLPALAGNLQSGFQVVGNDLSNTVTLWWIAVGGSVAVWLSLWANQTTPAFGKIARR
ncbi:MAG: hypothetical protein M3R30_01960 [Candidatus Eremiobacteraeota bacterium]|nr:hypothetical protein [Candidatus Eremiobacteraeota bacterium]